MSAAAGCTGGDGSMIVGGAAAEPIEIAPLLPLVPLGIAALYPAEQARILRLLSERIDVAPDGISVTLHAAGIRSLVAELADQEAPALARPNPCWRLQTDDCACGSRGRHSDIRIPIRLQRRGGRKLIMTPEGVAVPARKPNRDETLIKALVRARRWRRRIESGQAKSITDLAEQEGVRDAYICRLLPLTCRRRTLGNRSWMGGKRKAEPAVRLVHGSGHSRGCRGRAGFSHELPVEAYAR